MSASTTIHPSSGVEHRSEALFDHSGSTAWLEYGLGNSGQATDDVTFFVGYLSKDEADKFIKQQRKALRRMGKWNDGR